MKTKILIQSARPPFLLLPLACVLLGVSSVNQPIDGLLLSLIIVAALLANAAVNLLNEHYDFKSGLDLKTIRTPFSGGSGALVAEPKALNSVLILGLVFIALILFIGLYFVLLRGWWLIPFGLLGILIIATYTPWINKHPYLCLIAPGLGIGLMMVVGTQFVLTGQLQWSSFLIGLIPFLLINNLLLLNQYPDIDADKSVGRYHFPIAFGVEKSNVVFLVSLLISILLVVVYVQYKLLPMLSLVTLAPISLGFVSYWGAKKHGKEIGKYPQYLALNVMTAILTPVFLSASLMW